MIVLGSVSPVGKDLGIEIPFPRVLSRTSLRLRNHAGVVTVSFGGMFLKLQLLLLLHDSFQQTLNYNLDPLL